MHKRRHRAATWLNDAIIHSSIRNRLPPLISRLCHESRQVALRAGQMVQETPLFGYMDASLDRSWHGESSDVWYTDFPEYGSRIYGGHSRLPPLEAWNRPAIHWRLFQSLDSQLVDASEGSDGDFTEQSLNNVMTLLDKRIDVRVVVQELNLFVDPQHAIQTGLFGVCGDALFQILDLEKDEGKISAIGVYAQGPVRVDGFRLIKCVKEYKEDFLKDLTELTCLSSIKHKLRPAIAVRLCDFEAHQRYQEMVQLEIETAYDSDEEPSSDAADETDEEPSSDSADETGEEPSSDPADEVDDEPSSGSADDS